MGTQTWCRKANISSSKSKLSEPLTCFIPHSPPLYTQQRMAMKCEVFCTAKKKFCVSIKTCMQANAIIMIWIMGVAETMNASEALAAWRLMDWFLLDCLGKCPMLSLHSQAIICAWVCRCTYYRWPFPTYTTGFLSLHFSIVHQLLHNSNVRPLHNAD